MNGGKDMKKIDLEIKRYLTIGGTALICVGAVALILTNGTGTAAGQATEPSSVAPTSTEVSVPDIKVVSESSDPGAFVPSSGASAVASLTTISKPVSVPPKPTVNSSALTNKSSKPSYSSKPAVSKKPSNSTPKNGEVRNGKTWMDGFGWVEGTGGGEGTVVSGMHEGGSQVGIMD